MPSDVNKPDGSSPEEQRKVSDSQSEDVSHLDGKLQLLAEKPAVQSIVDRLMKPDGAEPSDEDLENHEEDEEGKETETDPVADGDGDGVGDEPDPEETETEKPKVPVVKAGDADPEETETEEPVVDPEIAGDDQDPDEQETAGYTRDANKRIRQLVERRKAAEAETAKLREQIGELQDKASYRDVLEKTLTEHKLDTKTWDEWTSLGLLMQSNPQRAAVTLAQMAKALGYRDPEGPIAKFDDDLEAMVKDQEMTKEAAEKLQRQRLVQQPISVPRNTQQQPTQTTDPRSPSLPRLTRDDIAVGQKAIGVVDAEFLKKYPDQWPKLVGEVQTMMAEYKGSPPALWGKIARDCAEKVIRKRLAKAPATSRPDPTLRASGGSSSRTVTRNNTGPAKSKSELADRIAAGTSGKGPIRR